MSAIVVILTLASMIYAFATSGWHGALTAMIGTPLMCLGIMIYTAKWRR